MTGQASVKPALSQSVHEEPVTSFDKREFDLLCRWSAGTVSCCKAKAGVSFHREGIKPDDDDSAFNRDDEGDSAKCRLDSSKVGDNPLSTSLIASAVNVNPADFGRACQRVIDFGRREYLRSHVLDATIQGQAPPELVSYVPADVTPQNALLIGWR
jgi:hypothetical protein